MDRRHCQQYMCLGLTISLTSLRWEDGPLPYHCDYYNCFWSGRRMTSTLYTDKKEKKIFPIYKEIQKGTVAKSYMRKGFLTYEEMRKYLVIYEEDVSHI